MRSCLEPEESGNVPLLFFLKMSLIWGIAKNLDSWLSILLLGMVLKTNGLFCISLFLKQDGWSSPVSVAQLFWEFFASCPCWLGVGMRGTTCIAKWVAFVFLRWQLLGRISTLKTGLNSWGWEFYFLLILKNSVVFIMFVDFNPRWPFSINISQYHTGFI